MDDRALSVSSRVVLWADYFNRHVHVHVLLLCLFMNVCMCICVSVRSVVLRSCNTVTRMHDTWDANVCPNVCVQSSPMLGAVSVSLCGAVGE